jgi:hypothetical protein
MTASKGTETTPVYSGGTVSTSLAPSSGIGGPIVRPLTGVLMPPPGQRDPVAAWLDSDEAARHQGHWVAVDADTGQFLAEADDEADWQAWQARGALLLFIDIPGAEDGA